MFTLMFNLMFMLVFMFMIRLLRMSHSHLHIKRPTLSFLEGMPSMAPQWVRNVEALDLSPCCTDPRHAASTKPPNDLHQRASQLTSASGKAFLEKIKTRTTRPQEVVAGTSLSQAKLEHTNQKNKDSEKNKDSD